ncbi:hypothetical protein AB870_22885 [Pandoraea faecigallinarum]|uniref:Major facilitator superfamily (MFS) profile domain-containing protein n=2 Tax=Pandoraea faecigallinarum TaxID=656179 RepID=A0A0H3WXH4_9BURK|nr:hypothetical protein AB870_22885 [Pandoraea faecigallinarum]
MFVVSALMMASYGVWSSSFALYALKINDGLEANTMEYGIMMAFIAIGALIGSELISRHRLHARGFILICLSSICIFLLPISCIFSKNKILIIIMIFIYGISLSAWNIVAVSYRQKFIPHHIFGRINGVYRTVSWGFMPIGALVGAGIVEKFDYQAAFGISALISIFQIFALPLMKNIQRQYQ